MSAAGAMCLPYELVAAKGNPQYGTAAAGVLARQCQALASWCCCAAAARAPGRAAQLASRSTAPYRWVKHMIENSTQYSVTLPSPAGGGSLTLLYLLSYLVAPAFSRSPKTQVWHTTPQQDALA